MLEHKDVVSPQPGTLTMITATFVGMNPIHFQVWRYLSATTTHTARYNLTAEKVYQPTSLGLNAVGFYVHLYINVIVHLLIYTETEDIAEMPYVAFSVHCKK